MVSRVTIDGPAHQALPNGYRSWSRLALRAERCDASSMKNSAAAHLRSIHHSGRVTEPEISDALQAVRALVQSLSNAAASVERSTGLTNAQLFLLQQIQSRQKPTVNDLAALAMTSQSTVSIVLSRLERRGLVARKRSATDARSVVLQLTASGKRVVERAPAPATSKMLQALRRLPPQELRALSRGLFALGRELGFDGRASMLFENTAPPARQSRKRTSTSRSPKRVKSVRGRLTRTTGR